MSAKDVATALRVLKIGVKEIPAVGGILESIIDASIEICDRAEGVKSNREEIKELAKYQAVIYKAVVEVYKEKVDENSKKNAPSTSTVPATIMPNQQTGDEDEKGLEWLLKVLRDINQFIAKHQEATIPPPTGKTLRIKWFFQRVGAVTKELLRVETVKSQIDDLRTSLDKAVAALSFELNLKTADLVQEIYKLAIDIRPVLDGVANTVSGMAAAMETQKQDRDEDKNEKKRQKLIEWLRLPAHVDDGATFARITDLTQPKTTCDWLFEHAQYRRWLEDKGLLWLQGIAGSGKTILASAVIRSVTSNYGDPVVYHYCDVKERSSVRNVLGNLLAQLIGSLPSDFDLSALEKQRKQGVPLASDFLLGQIKVLAASTFEQVVVVVDALDESENFTELALSLRELARDAKLRVLATIRDQHITLSQHELSISLTTEEASVNSSIAQFVRRKMDTEPFRQDIEDAERTAISEILVAKARGMFRLVELQITLLENCLNKASRDKVLASLPTQLDAMYARILTELPEVQADIAKRALLWVFGAQTPLTLEQLVDALMFDEATSDLNEDLRVKPHHVLLACRSLVSYDRRTARVMLSHATVLEYFTEHAAKLPLGSSYFQLSDVHVRLALQCLTYLCLPTSGAEKLQTQTQFTERCRLHPLVQYASFAWPKHVAMVDVPDDTLFLFISKLVDNADAGMHYCAYLQVSKDYPYYASARTSEPEPSWPSIVFCRQKWLVEEIFRCHPGWLATYHHVYSTPLILAARHCIHDVVHALVDLGAAVDQAVKVDNRDGTHSALYLTASRGLVDTCKVLLDHGADVNVRYEALETPLHVAALWGHAGVVSLLLQSGRVTRNIGNVHHATALHYAVNAAREDIVRDLLEYGFDPDARDDTGKVPLEIALRLRSPDVVRLLLDFRAQTEPLNVTVNDIEWARNNSWYPDLRSTLLRRADNCRLTTGDVNSLFRDLCALGPGLPDSVVVTILDMAELWVSFSSSSSKHEQVSESTPELTYLRLSVRPGSLVRAVKFVMVSHDQGWSGESELHGTYRGSFTWFDVTSSDPSLRPISRIQANIHALREARTHRITWDYSALRGEFQDWWTSLCAGHEIRLIPRAQFSGWINHVQAAEIEILCVFDPALMT